MSKFLVTGGAGFIGSNITRFLLDLGHQVRIFDNFSTGQIKYLADIKSDIECLEDDVRHVSALTNACQDIDYVLHHAAWRAVGRSVDNPKDAHEVNATATINVLTAARQANVKRVVFASSSAVYGETASGKSQEKDLPNPASPYAVAKLASEGYCSVFSHLYDLSTVSLRYFNVYGPYSRPESQYSLVIPIFLDQLLKKRSPTIHGTGEQSRDFVHVTDIARANVLAATAPNINSGDVFNIGSGTTTSINHVYQALQQLLGTNIEPSHGPKREGDVFTTSADISKAQQQLNYHPTISFQDGLNQSIEWYKQSLQHADTANVHQAP